MIKSVSNKRSLLWLFRAGVLLLLASTALASENAGSVHLAMPGESDDTMLMFVGEDLEILTIASRREEAAWSAPAVASVIVLDAMDRSGEKTLADLLGGSAGYYIEDSERGSIPFLRGVPDSTLFLHDTVPTGSAVNKSSHAIDHELSLAAVKRVEIIRGAGSVLWGPDAFAGVVNVVPMTGRDLSGFATGASVSSEEADRSVYVNYGIDKGSWNGFVSLSGRTAEEEDRKFNIARFWNDGITATPPQERTGAETPDDSDYFEFYSNASFGSWLTLSARITDNTSRSTVSNDAGTTLWEERRSTPTRTFKVEASKETGLDSAIRFTGYYTQADLDLTIVDRQFEQTERSLYGELIYDHALFTADGLFTAGASYRDSTFDDILVWKSFYPAFIDPNVTTPVEGELLPQFEQVNFDNRLYSVFGQYRHHFSDVDIWGGVRSDSHDAFEDKISYSAGVSWGFLPNLMFKALYGTAYRTPFARQVQEGLDDRLEKIDSANVQIAWKSGKDRKISLTLFRNEIDNHVIEDRFTGAGLSSPNSQTIYGAELEGDFRLTEFLRLKGNITFMDNSGSDESYDFRTASFVDDDGKIVDEFETLEYPYNPGVETLVNLAVHWNLTKNLTLIPELHYRSATQLYSPLEDITRKADEVWLGNLRLKIEDLFPFDLELYAENLADTDYDVPGAYTFIKGDGFNAGMTAFMSW